jgi:hypothetical protein
VLCMLSCFDIYFDGFLYFTCGVSDLVGRRIATSAVNDMKCYISENMAIYYSAYPV